VRVIDTQPQSLFSYLVSSNDFLVDVWNAVCTTFFLDTAHNIIDYIENIYRILQPGGYWLNFGKIISVASYFYLMPSLTG